MSRRYVAVVAAITASIAIIIGIALFLAGPTEFPRDAAAPNTGSSTPAPSAPAQHTPPKTYVALGDSYASMSSQSLTNDSDEQTAVCMRSRDNYPALLAESNNLTLIDVSCQGGTLIDITEPRDTDYGPIPPQSSVLSPDTDIVTLTMGGNDINFGDLSACANDDSECHGELAHPLDQDFAEIPEKLDAAYTAIKKAAPNARIITTGYLPLLSYSDTCPFAARLTTKDLDWFVDTTHRINDVLEAAALRHGATYVLPHDADKHTACAAPDEQWTSFDGQGTGAFPMHPTPAGQKAMADAIAAVL